MFVMKSVEASNHKFAIISQTDCLQTHVYLDFFYREFWTVSVYAINFETSYMCPVLCST